MEFTPNGLPVYGHIHTYLRYGTGEAVEKEAVVTRRFIKIRLNQFNNEFVAHQLSVVHYL